MDSMKAVDEALTYLGFLVGDRRPLEFNPKERIRGIVQELVAENADLIERIRVSKESYHHVRKIREDA